MTRTMPIFLFSLLCSLPFLLLAWNLVTDNLGANPVEALEHTTGDWTVYFLLLCLSVTPIQRYLKPKTSGWILPTHLIRRLLGLSAFAYGLLHLMTYWIFDMGTAWDETLLDLAERPFILIGFIAFLLLIPLVITSTQNWQKRLKGRWQTLHKSIYLITFLGILHYALLVKADLLQPIIYMGMFGILMLLRIHTLSSKR